MILFKYTDVFVTHNGDVTYEKIVNKKKVTVLKNKKITYSQKERSGTPKTLVAASYRSEEKN